MNENRNGKRSKFFLVYKAFRWYCVMSMFKWLHFLLNIETRILRQFSVTGLEIPAWLLSFLCYYHTPVMSLLCLKFDRCLTIDRSLTIDWSLTNLVGRSGRNIFVYLKFTLTVNCERNVFYLFSKKLNIMDLDPLRPKTVPLSAETILWFEFLLDPSLLTVHLTKENGCEFCCSENHLAFLPVKSILIKQLLFIWTYSTNANRVDISISVHCSGKSVQCNWHHKSWYRICVEQKWRIENRPQTTGIEDTRVESGFAFKVEFRWAVNS